MSIVVDEHILTSDVVVDRECGSMNDAAPDSREIGECIFMCK